MLCHIAVGFREEDLLAAADITCFIMVIFIYMPIAEYVLMTLFYSKLTKRTYATEIFIVNKL